MTKKREWPAMVTRDGKAIQLGQLLYHPSVTVSNYSDERHEADIEVYRVIDINLQYRTMRLRCHKGCETFIRMDNSCNRSGYFATTVAAENAAKAKLASGIKELDREAVALIKRVKAARKLKPKAWPVPA